jgi:hypothetical protein
MCPVCVANAVMTVAGVGASTGGLTAMMRILKWKRNGKKLVIRKFAIWRNSDGYTDAEAGAGESCVAAGVGEGAKGTA